MAKILAMASGGAVFFSAFTIQPGQPIGKTAIISAIICAVSVYKVWLNETRAENSRRRKL